MLTLLEALQDRFGMREVRDKGTWITLRDCPFENHTKSKWVFSVSVDKEHYHCFACEGGGGSGGSGTIEALLKHIGLDKAEIDLPKSIKNKPDIKKVSKVVLPPYEVFERRRPMTPRQLKVFSYLLRREIPENRIFGDRLGVVHMQAIKTVAGYSIMLKYRVAIPIIMDGAVVHAIYRDYTGKQTPKYLDLPDNPKRCILGNYDAVKDALFVRLVEGWFSAVKFNGLALLGKRLSTEQLAAIKKMPNLETIEVILDEGAEKSSLSIAARLLALGITVRVLFIKGQPDDYTMAKLIKLSWENSWEYKAGNKWRYLQKMNLRA